MKDSINIFEKGKILFALSILFISISFGSNHEIEYKDPQVAILQEIGVLQSGLYYKELDFFKDDWFDHFGAFWTQEAVIDERLVFTVGLGGLFEFPKSEKVGSGWNGNGNSLTKFFFVGPTQADFKYMIGDLEDPWLTIGMGMFPYKYNSEASNLGEYLFRSNPYPNYLFTGGYSILNNAAAYNQGIKVSAKWGGITSDLLLLTETTMAPLYDASLALIFNYRTPGNILDIGFGVNFKRLIAVKKEKTTPQDKKNAYLFTNNQYYTMDVNFYRNQKNFWNSSFRENSGIADSLTQLGLASEAAVYTNKAMSDSLLVDYFNIHVDTVNALNKKYDSLTSLLDTATLPGDVNSATATLNALPSRDYFSSKGTILMARATFDPKPLFGTEIFGPNDLKIFFEGALLGIKDYPVFYDDKMERLPIMFGINLPGFKFIDLISIQAEYYNSPYINSTENVLSRALPLPFYPSGGAKNFSDESYYDITEGDNWKWSVLIKKQVWQGIYFSAQFARDHLRMVSTQVWAGPKLDVQENLIRQKDWYWAIQMSMGL